MTPRAAIDGWTYSGRHFPLLGLRPEPCGLGHSASIGAA